MCMSSYLLYMYHRKKNQTCLRASVLTCLELYWELRKELEKLSHVYFQCCLPDHSIVHRSLGFPYTYTVGISVMGCLPGKGNILNWTLVEKVKAVFVSLGNCSIRERLQCDMDSAPLKPKVEYFLNTEVC